jgi:hypothetical protein
MAASASTTETLIHVAARSIIQINIDFSSQGEASTLVGAPPYSCQANWLAIYNKAAYTYFAHKIPPGEALIEVARTVGHGFSRDKKTNEINAA